MFFNYFNTILLNLNMFEGKYLKNQFLEKSINYENVFHLLFYNKI